MEPSAAIFYGRTGRLRPLGSFITRTAFTKWWPTPPDRPDTELRRCPDDGHLQSGEIRCQRP